MQEMRACDVPGSWRCLFYASALCGSSNLYQCYWLPRWLRCVSIVYQVTMLFTYNILFGFELADSGSSQILNLTINKCAMLIQYITIILLNIVLIWQTCMGSGLYVLFKTWKTFQSSSSYSAKHTLLRGTIKMTVGLIVIISGLIYLGCVTWYYMDAQTFIASYIFPALHGHSSLKLVFWMHVIIQVPRIMFISSYMLLCFVVLVDFTFLFRTLREDMEGVFSVPIVDDSNLEKCLHSISGLCDLVNAANGAFGMPLAIYLLSIVPHIINRGFQLIQWQGGGTLIIFVPGLTFAIGMLFLTMVPSAIMTAQVKAFSVTADC